MGNIVTSQETLQRVEAGVMRLTYYDDPIAPLDERDPSKDKSPHNALAQFRFGDQKRTELLRDNMNCRYVPDSIAVYYASSSR